MRESHTHIEWIVSSEPVDYTTANSLMEQRVADIRAQTAAQAVWLLEHPSLYTAGTSAKSSDLLDQTRFPVFESGRGGQFTYHGPGQRVAYVMLDLKRPSSFNPNPAKGPDIRAYVTFLESWMIATLKHYGLTGKTYPDRVGVWVDKKDGTQAKIGAIGIRVRGWVSYHGIALNVHPDLSHFSGIVPCGIHEHGVTSLADMGVQATIQEVDAILKAEFERLYNVPVKIC